MLQLSVFGPHFGLPDGSPFCIKALVLLKMSEQPFEVTKMNFSKAPKGKAPYLKDGDAVVADSHLIQQHLAVQHGVDFQNGYPIEKLAAGFAIARMLEEHFYFLSMNIRWLRDENFWKGPYQFFNDAPAPIRPLIARIVRKKFAKTQHLQGLGRHSAEERLFMAIGDLESVEGLLGDNNYLLGDKISGADASVFGFLWAAECPYFKSEIGDYIRTRPVLMAYLSRMQIRYFPDYKLN